MQVLERQCYCPGCRRNVLARENQFNVTGHAALCVLTCFLWLPVALVCMLAHVAGGVVRGDYLCTRCGARCH